MTVEDKIEELRAQVKKLQSERELAILEKGFAANANEDLRENAQYDYWQEREFFLTGKIHKLLVEIDHIIIVKKPKPRKKIDIKTKEKDSSLTQKHKWL